MANTISDPKILPELTSGLVSLEDFARYHFTGVLCVRGMLDQDTVDRLREATAEVVEAALVEGEAKGSPRPVGPHFHVLRRVYEQHAAFHDVLFNSSVAAVARDLMQSDTVIVFSDSLFAKEPGADIPTPWHHDLPFWPVRGEQVCTTWIALDPVTRESGGLEYVSGSHRWGRMFKPKPPATANHATRAYPEFEEIPDIEAERDRLDIVSWDLAPGDMLIHQALTVHGAGENRRRDLDRRGYAPRFVGEQATWEPGYHADVNATLADQLVKGDPLDRHGAFPVALRRSH